MLLERNRLLLKEKINIIAESKKYALSASWPKNIGLEKTQINDIMKNKSQFKK